MWTLATIAFALGAYICTILAADSGVSKKVSLIAFIVGAFLVVGAFLSFCAVQIHSEVVF